MSNVFTSVVNAITPGRNISKSASSEPSVPVPKMPNLSEIASEIASDIIAPVANMVSAAPRLLDLPSSETVAPTDAARDEVKSSVEAVPKVARKVTAKPKPTTMPKSTAEPTKKRGRPPGTGGPRATSKVVKTSTSTRSRKVAAPDRFEPEAFKTQKSRKPSGYFELKAILEEDDENYLVDWAGKDPKTKKQYEPSYIPKHFANSGAIAEWNKKQRKTTRGAKTGRAASPKGTTATAKKAAPATTAKKPGRPAGMKTSEQPATFKKRGRPAVAKKAEKPAAAKKPGRPSKTATKAEANTKAKIAKLREGRTSKRASLKAKRR